MNRTCRCAGSATGHPRPAADLADLHRTLLPTSPLLLLGRRFLEDFYYGVVPDEGLAFGTVAYENGRPGRLRGGHRRLERVPVDGDQAPLADRWCRSPFATLRHQRPVWQALRLLASEAGAATPSLDLGEILSLGVLPPTPGGPSSSKVRRTLSQCLHRRRAGAARRPARHRPGRRDEHAGSPDVRRHGVDRRRQGHSRMAHPAVGLPVGTGDCHGLTTSWRPGRPLAART